MEGELTRSLLITPSIELKVISNTMTFDKIMGPTFSHDKIIRPCYLELTVLKLTVMWPLSLSPVLSLQTEF